MLKIINITLACLLLFGFLSTGIMAQKKRPGKTTAAAARAESLPKNNLKKDDPENNAPGTNVVETVLANPKTADVSAFQIFDTTSAADTRLTNNSQPRADKNFKVIASANENPVFTVKMAKRGVVLVDFPAGDPVYKIFTGAQAFVYVGCDNPSDSGLCANSRSDLIELRPGENFHALGTDDSVSTVVTIQRQSGLVATLIVVPAATVMENTNYVAVEYSPLDVIAYRQSVGLPVNLLASTQIKSDSADVVGGKVSDGKTELVEQTESGETDASSQNDIENNLIQALRNATGANSAKTLEFQKPVYGLSLARIPFYDSRVKDITFEIIAVRNTLSFPVRLMKDQPRLMIADRNEKKQLINVKPLNYLHNVTNVPEDEVLQPGKIYYFAFAYNSPVMGVNQQLRAQVARREAEDAPVSIALEGQKR